MSRKYSIETSFGQIPDKIIDMQREAFYTRRGFAPKILFQGMVL
jgi:hypothetical protein